MINNISNNSPYSAKESSVANKNSGESFLNFLKESSMVNKNSSENLPKETPAVNKNSSTSSLLGETPAVNKDSSTSVSKESSIVNPNATSLLGDTPLINKTYHKGFYVISKPATANENLDDTGDMSLLDKMIYLANRNNENISKTIFCYTDNFLSAAEDIACHREAMDILGIYEYDFNSPILPLADKIERERETSDLNKILAILEQDLVILKDKYSIQYGSGGYERFLNRKKESIEYTQTLINDIKKVLGYDTDS